MKRICLFVLVLVLIAPAAFAQVGDSRALGLAGAMTAVNDDMNTLYYNPAGLAFLRKGYLNASANVSLGLLKGNFADEDTALPYVFYQEDSPSDYAYSDPFTGLNTSFDFDNFYANSADFQAFLLDETGEDSADFYALDSQDKKDRYEAYRELKNAYDGMTSVSPVTFNPRLELGGKHWGAALFGDYYAYPDFGTFSGTSTTTAYDVYRSLGAIAGIGLNFGPLAIGGNFKYVMSSSYSTGLDLSSFADGGPDSAFFQDLLNPSSNVTDAGTSMSVGLGAIVTLGTLNAAIYNDNIMPFLDKDRFSTDFNSDYVKAFLSTMSAGVSWMPSDNKFSKHKSPLDLILAVDLKNFGDAENRVLCAGAEFGLNAGDFLVGLVRAGYTQSLPGTLAEMASNYDPDLGFVSLGMTGRFWFAKFDAGIQVPTGVLKEFSYLNGSMTAAERAESFGTVYLTLSMAF